MASSSIILTAVLFMTGLGVLLASVLAVANRWLYVFEDPRVDQVEDLLPHANCGACGSPGCRAFAEKVVAGEAPPDQCTVNSPDMTSAIAELLGVALGGEERRVARLACAGGAHVARQRAHYGGLESCRAAALIGGGGKGCSWGCLGLADCRDVCDFNAIHMNGHGLPVVDDAACTACGECVDICPKQLFELHPVSHRLWVACRNHDREDVAEAECELLCTACERCVKDSPEGLIRIQGELATIDYSKNALASPVAIERCPTGAIVWIEKDGSFSRGPAAKKVIRKEALPVG